MPKKVRSMLNCEIGTLGSLTTGEPGDFLPGGLDLLREDALPRLRAPPFPRPVHLLLQLHLLLHHVRAHHLRDCRHTGRRIKVPVPVLVAYLPNLLTL